MRCGISFSDYERHDISEYTSQPRGTMNSTTTAADVSSDVTTAPDSPRTGGKISSGKISGDAPSSVTRLPMPAAITRERHRAVHALSRFGGKRVLDARVSLDHLSSLAQSPPPGARAATID